jgi:hypothetical protein
MIEFERKDASASNFLFTTLMFLGELRERDLLVEFKAGGRRQSTIQVKRKAVSYRFTVSQTFQDYTITTHTRGHCTTPDVQVPHTSGRMEEKAEGRMHGKVDKSLRVCTAPRTNYPLQTRVKRINEGVDSSKPDRK